MILSVVSAALMIILLIILLIIISILRRITFTSFREVLLLSQPRATFTLDKSRRKLGSIIQLIVRNVKHIFMRGYILQIAVLIAASGAFGDQIK